MTVTDDYFERLVKGPPYVNGEELRFELVRLSTFQEWPHWAHAHPTQLASAGFYYGGHGDTVTCFCCHGDVGQWQIGCDPTAEHRQVYPMCPLARRENSDNVPIIEVKEEPDRSGEPECNGATNIPPRVSNRLDQVYEFMPGVRELEEKLNEGHTLSKMLQLLGSPLETTRTNSMSPRPPYQPSVEERNRRTFISETRSSGTSMGIDTHQVKFESYRLRTFDNGWPETALVGPPELAKNGFFFLGNLDRVKCAFCNGILRNWRPDDRPTEEHRRHFSHCPFVRGLDVGNVSLEDEAQGIHMAAHHPRQPDPSSLGVLTERPDHPEYAIEAARVATFRNWPKVDIQDPDRLARAGFYYVGYSDNVKCFFCNGGLRNWDRPDEPWVEHARWYPHCGFLRMCKGEDYVHGIQLQYGMIEEPEPEPQVPPVIPGVEYRVDPPEVAARMDSPMVRVARQMGFPDNVIKATVEQRLRNHGGDFPTAEALIQAIFDLQEREMAHGSQQPKHEAHPGDQLQSSATKKKKVPTATLR